jgi:diguanylate cyclase (GGDEF)-like protein/PAS domain S-box-containing protein
MTRLRVSFQIALCLAMLSTSAFILAEALGMFPNPDQVRLEGRISFCESLAVQSTQLVNLKQVPAVKSLLESLAQHHPEIRSAALRRKDGAIVATLGKHSEIWKPMPERKSTAEQVFVPIVMNGHEWGALEVAFTPIRDTAGWLGWLPASYQLIAFVTAANGLLFIFYLRRVLYELDPQKSMPNRVRSALDTLVEGLLVLDQQGRIVMANRAFGSLSGRDPDKLVGTKASEIPWQAEQSVVPPWEDVIRSGNERTGVPLALPESGPQGKAFVVNAAPILDSKGVRRGVLASFGDVTSLENKKRELLNMLSIVQASREKISKQNEELQYLATRDPLTGCLNRRAFFEQFTGYWQASWDRHDDLSCVMVDVDHFKSINDRFGHSTGDEVLKGVAGALLSAISHSGLVCRFGGEEFCILLPACGVDIAVEAAERLREAIAALQFNGFQVTASLGVSSNKLGAETTQQMLDEADKCLYHAKRHGRNQVASWNRVPHDIVVENSKIKRESPVATAEQKLVQEINELSRELQRATAQGQPEATAKEPEKVASQG